MNTLFDIAPSLRPPAPPRRGPLSPKQRAIIQALRANGRITLDEAATLVGGNLYCNAQKHTGALLANMVKRGMIVRLKPGVFALP